MIDYLGAFQAKQEDIAKCQKVVADLEARGEAVSASAYRELLEHLKQALAFGNLALGRGDSYRVSRLTTIRERLDLSQQQFAERFLLPLDDVASWERDHGPAPGPVQDYILAIDANVDRVDRGVSYLKAIGKNFVPADIDRLVFEHEVHDAFVLYKTTADLSSHATWKKRRQRESEVVKAAKKLTMLLSADAEGVWLRKGLYIAYAKRDGSEWPDPTISFKHLLGDLNHLTAVVERDLSAAGEQATKGSPIGDMFDSKHSPFEQLVGEFLAKTYASHVRRQASSSTQDDDAGGPYVRFVQAVLMAYGITTTKGKAYSTQSIAKAVRKARPQAD